MKKDGESAHKLLSVREMKKAFDLDLATKEFKFIFEINKPASGSDPGGKGQYVVTVIRDTAASEAVVQTYIKGKVRLYGPDASSVIRLFDSLGNQVVAGKDGIAMDYEVGADGAFEIQPRQEGTYSMEIERKGYLKLKIVNIEIGRTFAKAMYDFGMLDLMPGNVVDAGDSKDVIDETDLEAFRKIMDGQNTVTVTYDEDTGAIIKTTSIGGIERTSVVLESVVATDIKSDTDNVTAENALNVLDEKTDDVSKVDKLEASVEVEGDKVAISVTKVVVGEGMNRAPAMVTATVTVNRADCDFNQDGVVDFKDLTYLVTHMGKKMFVIDNRDVNDVNRKKPVQYV